MALVAVLGGISLFINLCYAGFKLACAVWYSSFWDGAPALYYVLLCAVRVYLLRRVPKDGQKQDLNRELRYYRTTGIFLLLLDLALSGVVTQIVRDGYGSNYPMIHILVVEDDAKLNQLCVPISATAALKLTAV